MNEYRITFTLYPIKDGKISSQNHFSFCKATIQGDTYEAAVMDFRQEQMENNFYTDFIVEGDFPKVTFYDKKK